MRSLTRCALLPLLMATTWAATPNADSQFGFAQSLLKDGDQAFALLEFKRLVYLYPQHPKAPDSLLAIASIYLTYVGDVPGARKALEQVAKRHPKSGAAAEAGTLLEFIRTNSDFQGKPLLAFLKATDLSRRKREAEAVPVYLGIHEKWPRARLADQALLAAGEIQLTALNQPNEARACFKLLARQYPSSARLPEARLGEAAVVAKLKGDGPEALAAYRQVAVDFPKSHVAATANARAAAMEKRAHIIKRRFGKTSVLPFKVVKSGYDAATRMTVVIELSADASMRNVEATLEDALVTHYTTRKKPTDSVYVRAYYSYPMSEAGSAAWTPGKDAAYRVKERKTEDVLKGVLFDVLRRR